MKVIAGNFDKAGEYGVADALAEVMADVGEVCERNGGNGGYEKLEGRIYHVIGGVEEFEEWFDYKYKYYNKNK